MSAKVPMIGKRFGRLVVLEEVKERTKTGAIKYICKCDCGNIVSVVGKNLRKGITKSCGCLKIENSKKYHMNKLLLGYFKICNNCGKIFFVKNYNIKRGSGKYCCKECANIAKTGENSSNWKGGNVKCICVICGKEFEVYKCVKESGGGKCCSIECRNKYQKAENAPNWKGGKVKRICLNCGKEFEVMKCIEKINQGFFCSINCKNKYQVGKNSPVWKGGITSPNQLFRHSTEYTDWRTSCMARDDFTCQNCGKKGVMLNVHHIKTVKDIFDEYNIQTRDDWMNCSELWDLDNGITLCEKCHREIHFGVELYIV